MTEKKYRAWYQTGATTYVEFTADVDGMDDDERIDHLTNEAESAFWAKADTTLCHHCAGKVDLGDFELGDSDDAIEEVA